LSGRLDPFLVEVLRVVTQESSVLGVPFFVVGVTASLDIAIGQAAAGNYVSGHLE